jgi:hypothetical protein
MWGWHRCTLLRLKSPHEFPVIPTQFLLSALTVCATIESMISRTRVQRRPGRILQDKVHAPDQTAALIEEIKQLRAAVAVYREILRRVAGNSTTEDGQ